MFQVLLCRPCMQNEEPLNPKPMTCACLLRICAYPSQVLCMPAGRAVARAVAHAPAPDLHRGGPGAGDHHGRVCEAAAVAQPAAGAPSRGQLHRWALGSRSLI